MKTRTLSAFQLAVVFFLFVTCIIVALIFLSAASTYADEPRGISISEPFSGSLAPPVYPQAVYSMTPDEFYRWATEQNKRAYEDWERWHKTAQPRYLTYGAMDYSYYHNGHYFGTGDVRGSERYYEKRFVNPDYQSRPLTIINPFCPPSPVVTRPKYWSTD